jgi:transcriptional regulator with XRE-family HTH domain
MAPREALAARLVALRRQRGLTQDGLAKRAGLSRVFVARLETARQDPTLSTLVKLARALEVDVAEFVSPKGAAMRNPDADPVPPATEPFHCAVTARGHAGRRARTRPVLAHIVRAAQRADFRRPPA